MMLPDTGTVGTIDEPVVTSRRVFNELRKFAPTTYLLSTLTRVEDVEMATFFGFIYHYLEHDPACWLYFAESIERPASAEHSIYTRYYDINQVRAIYVQTLPQVCNVFVILRQDRYDDELMDRLLDREEKILDRYPNRLFNFQYLPLLEDDYMLPIPKSAVLILRK
jgi:hypothetical protein